MKLQLENLRKLRTAIIINRLDAAYYLSQKRAPSFAFFYKARVNTQKCYQCQLVCTIMINEWSKILAIKTLTEVNRT